MPSFPSDDHSRSVSSTPSNPSRIVRVLRRFFEQRISAMRDDALPAPYENVSTAHLAQFLVERTLARAALETATRSASTANDPEAGADRPLRLKVAALTVLRSLDL